MWTGPWPRAVVCEHGPAGYTGGGGAQKGGAMLLQPLGQQCGHGPCTRHGLGEGLGLCDRACSGGPGACGL